MFPVHSSGNCLGARSPWIQAQLTQQEACGPPSDGQDSYQAGPPRDNFFEQADQLKNMASQRPSYLSSPHVDYNEKFCDADLSKRPLLNESGDWDGGAILNAQSQYDTVNTDEGKGHQQERCGAAALVGGAVMAGREATERMVERLAAGSIDAKEVARLNAIRDRLADGSATHADLSRLQEAVYTRYNTDGEAGLGSREVTAAQKDLTKVTLDPVGLSDDNNLGKQKVIEEGAVVEDNGYTLQRVDDLKNGQSFTMNVDTDGKNGTNHAVQVGKDEHGRPYVYDPLPAYSQPHVNTPDPNDNPDSPYAVYLNAGMGDHQWLGHEANVILGGTTSY